MISDRGLKTQSRRPARKKLATLVPFILAFILFSLEEIAPPPPGYCLVLHWSMQDIIL